MASSSTQSILTGLRDGDDQVLSDVYTLAQRYCIRTLIRKTNCNKEDAEDLFMDSILIFRDNVLKGKLTSLTNLNSYIFGICWNLWREQNRAKAKWDAAKSDFEHQILVMETQEDLPFPGEELLEQKQLISKVVEALGELGERCRKLLTYFYVEHRSQKEIAELMAFSSANVVKVTRHRCYQQWRKRIEQSSTNP